MVSSGIMVYEDVSFLLQEIKKNAYQKNNYTIFHNFSCKSMAINDLQLYRILIKDYKHSMD